MQKLPNPASPLRILLISHTCQSRTEGQPKCERLAAYADIDLRVLVPDRWMHYGAWREADITRDARCTYQIEPVALPWAGRAQFYLHWYPRLAKILREFRPHIIDLWEEPWGIVSAHACRLRNRLLPGTAIISETEQNINKSLPPPFRWFRGYTLRNTNFAIARNREAVGVLRSNNYHGAAEVVPNGVDVDLFRPMDRHACRAQLGFNGFVVGYAGRLVAEKGLIDILQAVAGCPEHIKVVIVGDGALRSTMESEIRALGVGTRVRLLPAMPPRELPVFMNAIDCLAVPSHTTHRWKEQFGRVIIEAHACGTPVIGSNSGAIPDVVEAGGIVVPEKSPAALANAIRQLAADPALCAAYGAAGRQQVFGKYTWDAIGRQMHAIYRRFPFLPLERES